VGWRWPALDYAMGMQYHTGINLDLYLKVLVIPENQK
jgi:hypothetical protein